MILLYAARSKIFKSEEEIERAVSHSKAQQADLILLQNLLDAARSDIAALVRHISFCKELLKCNL
jgi:hypothetical protein